MRSRKQQLSLSTIVLLATFANHGASAQNFFEHLSNEAGRCLHGGCDAVAEVNRRIDQGIASKMESVATPVKQAFEAAMHDLFSNNLNPFLDRVDVLTSARLTQVDDIINDAIKKAHDATDATIDKVKKDIIDRGKNQIEVLSKDILGDYKCAINDTSMTIDKFIDTYLNPLKYVKGLISHCGVPDESNFYSLYESTRCENENLISSARSIRDIKVRYGVWIETQRNFECAIADETNKKKVESDRIESTRKKFLWDLATR